MPQRAYVPLECTQNDPYTLIVPMQDATLAPIGVYPDGTKIYPPRNLTGCTFEGTAKPGWNSDVLFPFDSIVVNTTDHQVEFSFIGATTDSMPLDNIYDLVETTGGGRFTFQGGPFVVRRKVTP